MIQIVADHGREGDGFDDHHAGGGGHSADEDQQRQGFLLFGHGQRKHEGIGIDSADKLHHPAEGNGQNKDINYQ